MSWPLQPRNAFTGETPNQPPCNVVLKTRVLAPSCTAKSPWDVTSQSHGTSLYSHVPQWDAGWVVLDVPSPPLRADLLHLARRSNQLSLYHFISKASCHPAPLVTPCHPPTPLTPQPFAASLAMPACRILQRSGNYRRQLPASSVITALNGTRNMLII